MNVNIEVIFLGRAVNSSRELLWSRMENFSVPIFFFFLAAMILLTREESEQLTATETLSLTGRAEELDLVSSG